MEPNQTKEFKLTFPADHFRSELAGKEASFKVTVIEVKQEVLPELDDNFAKVVNPDFASIDKLRKAVTADLKSKAEEKAKVDFENELLDALVARSQIDFPPILVEAETDRMLNRRFPGGEPEMDLYLKSTGKTVAEMREELVPLATRRTNWALALEKVVEAEKIEADAAEVDKEIERAVASTEENKEKLKELLNTQPGRESISQRLMTAKALDRLVAIATGSGVESKRKGKGKKSEEG